MRPRVGSLFLHFNRTDLDVAEGNLAVIALEGEVALVRFGKEGHRAELALGDALVEVFATEDVIEILYAVDFMLALFRADEEADVVPLPGGFGGVKGFAGVGVRGWLVKSIEPA